MEASDYTVNVQSLGKYGMWLCEGPIMPGGSGQVGDTDFTYFTSRLTSGGDVFGGTIIAQSSQASKVETIKKYWPGTQQIEVSAPYVNKSNYKLKLVNLLGDYIVDRSGSSSSNVFNYYSSEGVYIGTFTVSDCIDMGSVLFAYMLHVSNITIPLTSNSSYYVTLLQSNRYHGSSEITGGNKNNLINFLNGSEIMDSPTPGPGGDDPFSPGGTTGDDETDPTGGDGNFDNESDDIAIPLPPTNTAVDSGFITLYNPTISEIQALGAFMWSDLFDLETFKKLFGDPMGAILGLSLVPVQPPQGSTVEVKIGNVLSGIRMKTISNQFIQKDFGTITLNEYWGGYLDYSPYTQVEIYLPFIGVKPLSVDDVMGKSIHLVYNIDLLSGACMAFIAANEDVLYQFIGQCSCSVPITGSDWTNVINGVLGIAGAIGTTVATGGLSAPQAIGAVTALASSVASSKPKIEKSGSLSGMGGMLGVFSPYLIITRPRQALPASQNTFEGYPAFITRTLSTVSGFTRVREVHLDGITCTDQEKTEIKRLLDEGVIF